MIPSGLQALMEASAVLQQQASQTAPGPQGQQPTVASQVMQQAQQVARPASMPQMQAIGKQAGIAGQLMAQQQQQQQQAAQNPQAVAQMAAQMLKQQGVAGLPVNMQFKEGGIIGFAGEERSDVPDPEAGLSMAERARRQRREKGSIYDPYFGLPPAIREAMRRDEEARREGVAAPESIPVPGPAGAEEVPRAKSEREAIEAEQRVREQRLRDAQLLQQRREAQRAGVMAALPQAEQAAAIAGGAKALEDYYVPYPERGPMRATTSRVAEPEPATMRYTGPDEQFARAPRTTPSPAGAAPAAPQPTGIAALTPPRAAMPTPKSVAELMREVPEDAEAKADIARIQDIGRRTLEARRAMPDLEQQEIAARERARAQRQQLLESQRNRDIYKRFRALFNDLRTWGNEYGAVDRAIEEREKAAIDSNLLHDQAIIKLRQAQQARQLGDMEAEAGLVKQGMDLRTAAEKRRMEAVKLSAEIDKVRVQGEQKEATSYADRLSNLQLKLADLAQREAIRKDERLNQQYTAAAGQLSRAQAALEKAVQKKFGSYLTMRNVPGSKPDPKQEKDLKDYINNLTDTMITPLERQVDALAAKVLGTTPAAAPAGETIKFDASGNRIR